MKTALTAWADDVLENRVPAGELARAACRRHFDDLKSPRILERYFYDEARARHVVNFFESECRLAGGRWEGAPFVPLPWIRFVVAQVFGWVSRETVRVGDKDIHPRRFRFAYIESGKGSGKSPLAAGIALYMTVIEPEPRAENIIAANTHAQAGITFSFISSMVHQSPFLRRACRLYGGDMASYALLSVQNKSRLIRLSADRKRARVSGPTTHLLVLDELHELTNGEIKDVLLAGTKTRTQPLVLMTTNAGAGRASPCGREREYADRVLTGALTDDAYFAFVAAVDRWDAPATDESCWAKANPAMATPSGDGIPGRAYIRGQLARARGNPSAMAIVDRLNFGIWRDALTPWIDPADVEDCLVDSLPPERHAWTCYAGLDLATRDDFSALALVWRSPAGDVCLEIVAWTAADTLAARAARDQADYERWAAEGFLRAVPGVTLPLTHVAHALKDEFLSSNHVVAIAYDQYRIATLRQDCADRGLEFSTGRVGDIGPPVVIAHPQGFWHQRRPHPGLRLGLGPERSISVFETLLLEKKISILRNPVLVWAIAGAAVESDPAGNRKIVKNRSAAKVDALVAATQALGLMDAHASPDPEVDARVVEATARNW